MKDFNKELRNGLKPLYQELMSKNTFDEVCTFCVQWGENFPTEDKSSILFVGKAVNGWHKGIDVNKIFGDSDERIFARDDQMIWVSDQEGENDYNYNINKSAFWRVVKKISQHYYPYENWYSYVAWSNLCKIAPYKGGNPGDPLYREQLESCQKILAKEIEILSPKFVVMLTSGWENDFLKYLNDNNLPESEKEITWNGNETKLFKIDGTIYIASQHPQGKAESIHIEAIKSLMSNN